MQVKVWAITIIVLTKSVFVTGNTNANNAPLRKFKWMRNNAVTNLDGAAANKYIYKNNNKISHTFYNSANSQRWQFVPESRLLRDTDLEEIWQFW